MITRESDGLRIFETDNEAVRYMLAEIYALKALLVAKEVVTANELQRAIAQCQAIQDQLNASVRDDHK